MSLDNPRAGIGDNVQTVDYAKEETERLLDEYRGLFRSLDDIKAELRSSVAVVNSDQDALEMGGIVKRARDLRERIENVRAIEKEPHLRRGNAVDSTFNGAKKELQPDDRNERRTKPGVIDIAQGRINVWQDHKERLERERLERERIEAARIAREAHEKAERERAEAQRLQREAEERQREAQRARAPAQIEQKALAAQQAMDLSAERAAAAISSMLASEQAAEAAQGARIATLAKPSDIVRTRGMTVGGAGVTLTKARESYAYVTNRDLLDRDKLWNCFTDDQIEQAVRKWARNSGFNEPMEGAEIGWRSKGVTR